MILNFLEFTWVVNWLRNLSLDFFSSLEHQVSHYNFIFAERYLNSDKLNFYFGVYNLPCPKKFYLDRFEVEACVDWSHQGNLFSRTFNLKFRTCSSSNYFYVHYLLPIFNRLVWTSRQDQRAQLSKEGLFYFFVLKQWHHLLYTRWASRWPHLFGYVKRKTNFSIMILLLFLFPRCCVTDPFYFKLLLLINFLNNI